MDDPSVRTFAKLFEEARTDENARVQVLPDLMMENDFSKDTQDLLNLVVYMQHVIADTTIDDLRKPRVHLHNGYNHMGLCGCYPSDNSNIAKVSTEVTCMKCLTLRMRQMLEEQCPEAVLEIVHSYDPLPEHSRQLLRDDTSAFRQRPICTNGRWADVTRTHQGGSLGGKEVTCKNCLRVLEKRKNGREGADIADPLRGSAVHGFPARKVDDMETVRALSHCGLFYVVITGPHPGGALPLGREVTCKNCLRAAPWLEKKEPQTT